MPIKYDELSCVGLICRIQDANDVGTYAKLIVDKWGDESLPDLTMDVLKTPLYHSLYHNPDSSDPAQCFNIEKLQELLTQQWLEMTDWKVANFWEELGTVMEVMWQRNEKVIEQVAKTLSGWIAENQTELEQVYFSHPHHQALMAHKGGVNTDFSVLYRMVCDDLVEQGKRLPWSDAFVWSLYNGEYRPEDRHAWVEYKSLPTHLVFDFAYQGILHEAFTDPEITREWILRKTQREPQLIKLATAALAHTYFDVEAFLAELNPQIARQVMLGHDLMLSPEEILNTIRYDAGAQGQLPVDFTIHSYP